MKKSKSDIVTRDIIHLVTTTLPVLVIQSVFSLLTLGRYLLPLTALNRYQPTDRLGVENSFLPLHQVMYLLSEIECLWLPYCPWILS